jgi:hypothetical protein
MIGAYERSTVWKFLNNYRFNGVSSCARGSTQPKAVAGNLNVMKGTRVMLRFPITMEQKRVVPESGVDHRL